MTKDPKGRKQPGFQRHAFVCGHERPEGAARPSCTPKGSMELMRSLKHAVRERDIEGVRVQKSGCLDYCEYGPTCVVYPEGTWYSLTDERTLEAVLEHLASGTIDPSCTLKMD